MPCTVPIFLQSWTRCQWVRGQTSPGRRGHTHGRVRLQRWTRHVSDTWLRVLVSGLPSGNVRSKCVLRHLGHRWGARAQHAVLVRIASHRLTQRAASFADGPTRNHCSWPTPRPRWVGCARLKTRNRFILTPRGRDDAPGIHEASRCQGKMGLTPAGGPRTLARTHDNLPGTREWCTGGTSG